MSDSEVYVIAFRWWTDESSGTGQAFAAGADPADAERRWREDDPAEWPKFEVIDIAPLGDRVITRYNPDVP